MLLKYYKATSADFYNILDLFNVVSSDSRFTEKWLKWKYIDNPSGRAHVYFAEDQEKKLICGTYSMFPWNILVRGERVKCAQAGDLLVLPDYRRKGIFKELTYFMQKDLSRSDISMLMGFSNEKAFPGHMKFGWRNPGHLKTYIKIVDINKLLSILRLRLPKKVRDYMNFIYNRKHIIRCNRNRSFKLQNVNKLDEIPEEPIQISHEVQIHRDAKYLKWRYIDKPDNKYQIFSLTKNHVTLCLIILVIYHNEAYILDIIPATSSENILIALSFVIQHLLKKSVNVLKCSCIGPITKMLKKAGFFYKEEGGPIVTYKIDEGIGIDDICLKRWLLFSGDSDAA